MARFCTAFTLSLALLSTPAGAVKTRPHRTAKLDTGALAAPASPFDCDTARASEWFGSTRRCLDQLCRGQNVTNGAVIGGDGRLRTNPCVRLDR
jgi:hypothetical protein